MRIQSFCFNPFAENTYLLISESKNCIIIDPGMSNSKEDKELFGFIEKEGLTIKRLILTHCHLDHVFGNRSVHEHTGLHPEFHIDDLPVFEMIGQVASMYAIPMRPSPEPKEYLDLDSIIKLDEVEIELRKVPGHAPGHVILIDHATKQVIAGDTLFRGSIGRTDLPGGDHDLLLSSIKERMFSLGDDYVVHPGHGPTTKIGWEKINNPFVGSNHQG